MSEPTNPKHGEPGHDCGAEVAEKFVREDPVIPDMPFRLLGGAVMRKGGLAAFRDAGEQYPPGMPLPEPQECVELAEGALQDALLTIAALAATAKEVPADVEERAQEHFTRIIGVAGVLHARNACLRKRTETAKDN